MRTFEVRFEGGIICEVTPGTDPETGEENALSDVLRGKFEVLSSSDED